MFKDQADIRACYGVQTLEHPSVKESISNIYIQKKHLHKMKLKHLTSTLLIQC